MRSTRQPHLDHVRVEQREGELRHVLAPPVLLVHLGYSPSVVRFNLLGGDRGPHGSSLRAALPELRARFGPSFASHWKE